jgi:hypothetical protein
VKVSEREKYLIAVMPAIFVAVAYVWWVEPAVNTRLEAAKKQYESMANSPKLSEGARASDKLRDALDAATEKNREIAQRLAAVEKRWCNVPQRAATIKAVSALFARAQLSLEKSLAEKKRRGCLEDIARTPAAFAQHARNGRRRTGAMAIRSSRCMVGTRGGGRWTRRSRAFRVARRHIDRTRSGFQHALFDRLGVDLKEAP